MFGTDTTVMMCLSFVSFLAVHGNFYCLGQDLIDCCVGCVTGSTVELRDVWEAGAFHLERLQAAEECVNAEQAAQAGRQAPTWTLPYTPAFTPDSKLQVGVASPTCPTPLPSLLTPKLRLVQNLACPNLGASLTPVLPNFRLR